MGTRWLLCGIDEADMPQAAAAGSASEACSTRRQVGELIDFFASDEKKRTPPPPPDRRDLLMADTHEIPDLNITIRPPGEKIRDEGSKPKRAALEAQLQSARKENQWLSSKFRELCRDYDDPQRHSRPFTFSSPLLHPRPPSNDDASESSNSPAMRGHNEAAPADDVGLPEMRKEEAMAVDEASDVSSEGTVEDNGQRHGQNSNGKLKLSSPPPAAAKRKPRVTVRFRTETDDISGAVKIDGCQWRKYGQKTPKASLNTPRCYYRCSMACNCPVRKHLQKWADDNSIVNATYEGVHSHQLPPAALPMDWATTAALQMVVSGSMPSGVALMDTHLLAATMPPGARAPQAATVSISTPFPSALLDLSKGPDPALLQGQPAVVQFPAAVQGGATLGGQSQPQYVFGQATAAAPGFAAPAGPSQPQYVFGQAAAAVTGGAARAGPSQSQYVFGQAAAAVTGGAARAGPSQPQYVFGQAAAAVPGGAIPGGWSQLQYVFGQAEAAVPGGAAPAGPSQPQQVYVQQAAPAAVPGDEAAAGRSHP